MNHIVIIGFMGSGKTRVGKRLAKDFNLPFVDVDRVVSKKMNLTMKEIFDRFGEPFYRALETTVIKALIDDPEQKIISLGSGLPMQEQNAKYIKKLGTVVYLKGSYATLKKRLENSSSNPLIEGEDKEDLITIAERAKNRGAEVKWLSSNALIFEDNDGILTRVRKNINN